MICQFTSTTYYNKNGVVLTRHAGVPRKKNSFEKRSKDATCILIERDVYYGGSYGERPNRTLRYFNKSVNGKWLGNIWNEDGKYFRYVLTCKKTLMHICWQEVSKKVAEKIIKKEVASLKDKAREVISWCDTKYDDDEHGRYWLSAYHGCGNYILIVDKNRKVIAGSIHECDSSCYNCSEIAWNKALKVAIQEKMSEDEYIMLEASGSCTYFMLLRTEDEKYLTTERYGFPKGYYSSLDLIQT